MTKVIDENECVYEVVTGEWKEMYDFDGNDVKESAETIIDNFIKCHQKISPEQVHVKECVTNSKMSLHFVIPKTVLPSCQAMRTRFALMMAVPGLMHVDKYDGSIYTKDRLIRTVRSDKCFQGRPFKSTSSDNDLFVSLPLKMPPPQKTDGRGLVHDILNKYNLDGFKPHSEISPGVFRIIRTEPSFCIVCHRVHESENACIDTEKMIYVCFRSPESPIKLDTDIIRISRARITVQLREFGIAPADIATILSRAEI
jgi:hypothetical protein